MKRVYYLLAILGLLTSITTANISDGLIAHWSFDDTINPGKDSTGNGHDGVVHGNPFQVNGIIGKALDFDGVDDYIDIANVNDFKFSNQSFTISAWVQIVDNSDYHNFVVLCDPDYYPRFGIAKSKSGVLDGKIYAQFGNNDGSNNHHVVSEETGSELPKNTWMHLVAVVDVDDTDQLLLYLNGDLQDSLDLSSTIFDFSAGSDLRLFLAANPTNSNEDGFSEPHNSLIDEVRIYDRALSEEEIQQLKTIPTPYYERQVVPFIDPTLDFVFIKNTFEQNTWAGEDYGAIRVVAINDNQDSLGLGTPLGHFTGNQGLVVAYDVLDESGNGAICALGAGFPEADGGPGYSSLPTNLEGTTLNVDISFQIPENPAIETLSEALSFWLIEADGDEFETEGIVDINRDWQTYTYDVNDIATSLVNSSGGGIFGDSPVTLFALQFEDPNNISGISSIIYSIDNFKISGSNADFYEDYENKCVMMPIGDLNKDCKVNLLDFAILAQHWLEDYTPPSDKIAIINPDNYRILKHGIKRNTTSYYSLAYGQIADSGSSGSWSDFAIPGYWSGVGEQTDFIGSILENAGFTVDYYEASNMPAISFFDYGIVIVQDPLKTNLLQFTTSEVEDGSPDLLEYVTDSTFLSRIDNYIKSGGNVVLSGDAVKLLEDGANRLNYGKSVQEKRAANTPSQTSDRIPNDWLFVRGNPFCGVDRVGSGSYTVLSGSLLPQGTIISQLQLQNLNDQPTCEVWSDTAYYPSDGISLLDVEVTGSSQYVLDGSTCYPPVYSATVNDTINNFIGYTNYNAYKIYYIASDSLFDYQNTNNIGKWHVGQYSQINYDVTTNGENMIVELVNHIFGP